MEAIEKTCKNSKKTHEPSRSQNTDKPSHQENINMDGKFQEIMHMPYNLMFKMAIKNGRMLLTWKSNKSRNTKYSKIMEWLFRRKIRLLVLQRDIKTSEYILSLMSNTVENSKQDLRQIDILPRNLMKLSIQELLL